MKLFEFLEEYGNNKTIIEKLRQIGLLRTELRCESCQELMRERKMNCSDGIMFECSKRSCRHAKSIRVGSFFENVKLGLCDSLLLLHLWCKGYTEKLICDDFNFSARTVVDWFQYCRELCVQHFEQNIEVIGGAGCVVEIDETLAVKRKYNRGRMLAAGWLFGGIERRDDGQFKCFFRMVYDRSGPHLKHLIREHVAVGTHIITDGWGAYIGLSELGYQHSVVVHEENFVSPNDPKIHTQKIEATWSSFKRFIRSRGNNKSIFYFEYICEYLFRRKNMDVFEALIDETKKQYSF
jgi:hypothetical protein